MDMCKWEKWQRWVETIRVDLSNVVDDHVVFMGFRQVVRQNEEWIWSHNGSFFIDLVVRSYLTAAFMGIRRHLRAGKDAVSLMRLLKEMSQSADQVTYRFYLERFPLESGRLNWQKRSFKKLSEDGNTVSKKLVDQDICEAETLASDIGEIADRVLAHRDPRGTSASVPREKLCATIKHFEQLALKYLTFLTGGGLVSLEAEPPGNWREIFDHPLIKPADTTAHGAALSAETSEA